MSGTFDTVEAELNESTNKLLTIKNQIYNESFDKSKYFLSYPFEEDNVNGIFLYKVAFYYYDKIKTYPFCGDMEFARMFILGEVFGDENAAIASKMFYIFHLLLKNIKTSENNEFKVTVEEQEYSGDINDLCVYFYNNKTFDQKYAKFVQMISNIRTEKEEYSLPVQNSTEYAMSENSAQQNFVEMEMFQNEDMIQIQSCINRLNLTVINSTVGNIDIKQSCQMMSSK